MKKTLLAGLALLALLLLWWALWVCRIKVHREALLAELAIKQNPLGWIRATVNDLILSDAEPFSFTGNDLCFAAERVKVHDTFVYYIAIAGEFLNVMAIEGSVVTVSTVGGEKLGEIVLLAEDIHIVAGNLSLLEGNVRFTFREKITTLHF